MNNNENTIDMEKVTFKEWWSFFTGKDEEPPTLSELELDVLYNGYWNFCWYREVIAESKEEVKAYVGRV